MKPLGGITLPTLPISGLRRVRDLIYYDGPLLSHFEHANGDDYLYYWCDCDESTNRWMVLRVDESSILRLINRFVPLDYVIPGGCRDDFVYFVDIGSDSAIVAASLLNVARVPEDYVPDKGV